MVRMAWASGLFGGNGSGSARGGSDRGSTRPRKALLELLGTGEMDWERERGKDAAEAGETESARHAKEFRELRGANKSKRKEANASKGKQRQTKASSGKQRQAKASKCKQRQAKASKSEQKQIKASKGKQKQAKTRKGKQRQETATNGTQRQASK